MNKFTVAAAAKQLGYDRFTAAMVDEDGVSYSDAARDTILVKKVSELRDNRATYMTEDGSYIDIARLFRMK